MSHNEPGKDASGSDYPKGVRIHHENCARDYGHRGACRDANGGNLPDREPKPVTDQLLGKIADRAGKISEVAEGTRLPDLPPDELQPILEKVGYSPDHPRVEVRYYDPNGFSVEMSIEVPDEIKPYYDADMALNSAGYAVQRLMSQVVAAKRNHEEVRPEPTGE